MKLKPTELAWTERQPGCARKGCILLVGSVQGAQYGNLLVPIVARSEKEVPGCCSVGGILLE